MKCAEIDLSRCLKVTGMFDLPQRSGEAEVAENGFILR